jgi:hypothetical protein
MTDGPTDPVAAGKSASTVPTPRPAATPATRPEYHLPDHLQDKPRPPSRGVLRALVSGVGNVVFFVPRLVMGKRRAKSADEVTVYSAHPAFYLWLLILVGFVASRVAESTPVWGETLGWIYVWTTIYLIATLLYDFNVKKLALWVGIFCLIWLFSKYVENLKNIAVVGRIFQYLSDLNPKLDPGTATAISWLLILPWIGSLFEMSLNRRKRFSPNEIAEFHFGEGSELTDRSGLRFRTRYRDVLETLLSFGGGDLLAFDNRGMVVKQYENIIGLYFLWPRLDRVLHQRVSVIEDADGDEPPKPA